jgi:hypothetical protein
MRASPGHGPRWAPLSRQGALNQSRGLHFRGSRSNAIAIAIVIFSKTCAKTAVPASITERQMRCRLTLAMVAAFVAGPSIAAHAQAPDVVNGVGGVAGTGIDTGAGAAGQGAGTGIGTGAGATGQGAGTGGILGTTRAGTGGLRDNATFGSATGGITVSGSGRGSSAGTGGTKD